MSDDYCKTFRPEKRGFANTDLYCRFGGRGAGP
jgi:hypothetical protein